ncbi:MAG: hypothetical protein RRY39_06605 [Odoribacter sp.]
MKYANYDKKPAILEAIGNGSYFYRWDIKEERVEHLANNPMESTSSVGSSKQPVLVAQWSCLEVIVWGTLTANKITESVISAMWGNGVEAKLLNDYNASVLGVLDNSYTEKYRSFLSRRKLLKEHIDADCVILNIPL